ncbi:phospholipase D-like domain-containing protein [Paenibacillus sp. y28]|uniref:phospholipase D-like domain-containing protein n=1 Tax=Paenibacillus sp. y28 TaxID=3129110 RepID=UPI00301ADF9D
MPQLLGDTFSAVFLADLAKCTQSVTIVSPYITYPAVQQLLDNLPDSCKSLTMITIPMGFDYISGAVDIAALAMLRRAGFSIRTLDRLHTKLYVLDDKAAYTGSANFTSSGWCLDGSGNVEAMVRIKLTGADRMYLKQHYVEPSVPFAVTDGIVQKVKAMEDAHKQALDHIRQRKEQLHTEMKAITKRAATGRTEPGCFMMFSRRYPPIRKYPYVYRFALSKGSGEQALEDQLDFHLKLGGEQADAFIIVPHRTMKRVLTKSHLDGAHKAWQFQISIDSQCVPHLRSFSSSGKETVIALDSGSLQGQLPGTTYVI